MAGLYIHICRIKDLSLTTMAEATIHHLPYEILSQIFLASLPLGASHPAQLPAASSLDQHLQRLAQNSHFDAGLVVRLQPIVQLEHNIAALRWRSRNTTFYSVPPAVIHTLNECSSRWYNMHFVLNMHDMCQLDPKDGLPRLQRLGLEECQGWDELELPLQTFSNAPALRHLYLGVNFSLDYIELPWLQVLRVDTPGWLDRWQYLGILENLPNIEGVHMQILPMLDVMHSSPQLIQSNIRVLALSLPSGESESYIDTLDFLTCPALESLTISSSPRKVPFLAGSLTEFISRSSPPLRELKIENPYASDAIEDLVQCLVALPTLEVLSVKALALTTARDILRRMSDDSQSAPTFLPRLQRLDISVAPLPADFEWNFDEVLPMLHYRWNVQPQGDISRLQVFKLTGAASWRPNPVLAQLEVLVDEGMVVEIG
ncbi:hypothetical protein FB45DRAFT_930411 [Roridomyces roridus]|uniref:F-box domain-containing protein n=1 Tax=Roridomyces roridus TaxID=1738132 RepID=A0AAD7BFM1_9AGAR|nr:hypothetical protein FB45DRAFT_930411 [Roridomyces roridus]